MDWTQIIITAITVLIGGGGLVTLFTIQDKKNEAFLNNVAKLIDQWQKMAEDRKTRAEELKRDLDKKDNKIDELYDEISKLREELDHARTDIAVARLLKCETVSCASRIPPFGADTDVSKQLQP